MSNFARLILLLNSAVGLEVPEELLRPVHPYYDPEKCGKMNMVRNAQLKIMGGRNAALGEVPWAVALFYGRVYYCTGTLISLKHVITAGHCFPRGVMKRRCLTTSGFFQEEVIEKYSILYGSNCLVPNENESGKENLCGNAPQMKRTRIIRAQHGRFFYANCLMSDFALLELEDVINETTTNYICLSHRHVIREADILQLIGYGWGANPPLLQQTMNNLQVIDFPNVFSRRECLKKWQHMGDDSMCTVESRSASTCLGDSGGGLAALGPDGQWSLLGVLSYGTDCKILRQGGTARSQVYTDISFYSGDIDMFTGYKDTLQEFHTLLLKSISLQ